MIPYVFDFVTTHPDIIAETLTRGGAIVTSKKGSERSFYK